MDGEVSLEFVTGNPQLGVLSGRLTYLGSSQQTLSSSSSLAEERAGQKSRENHSVPNSSNSTYTTTASGSSSFVSENSTDALHGQLPERRSKLLCILSVPAHMVPTDMLQFAAPFKDQVHSIRILRPCNPVGPSDPARTPAEYMVLLQMESQVPCVCVCMCVSVSTCLSVCVSMSACLCLSCFCVCDGLYLLMPAGGGTSAVGSQLVVKRQRSMLSQVATAAAVRPYHEVWVQYDVDGNII